MSALSRHPESPFIVTDWQADVTQIMDESHLVAWSNGPRERMQFGVSLGQFLESQRDTEVCNFYGQYITDIESFCHQLERAIPGPRLDRRVDGPSGISALLRTRHTFRGRPATKYRYYIWHDADSLVRANRRLFGRLLDALAGIAAEAEYVSDDMLLLHRTVLVGGRDLRLYAEDPVSQCNLWYDDGQGEPFWQVVTDIQNPAFSLFRIDQLLR